MSAVTPDEVSNALSRWTQFYRNRQPTYQTSIINQFLELWDQRHVKLLDVGAGTGLMGLLMREFLPIEQLNCIDVTDRVMVADDLAFSTYDGENIPFPDGAFDCVSLVNVVHHVPVAVRGRLLKECFRVGKTVYIKDHLMRGPVDAALLATLDLIGNVPFGGMVQASYLSASDWDRLAQEAAATVRFASDRKYRAGALEAVFPSRLEIAMRWDASAGN